jgi:hypothetical protein
MKAIDPKNCYNSYVVQKSSIKWTINNVKPCDKCKHCIKTYNFDGWEETLCTKFEMDTSKNDKEPVLKLKNDKYFDDKYLRCIDVSVARFPDFELCGIEAKYFESIEE